jgi:hypothetical protein
MNLHRFRPVSGSEMVLKMVITILAMVFQENIDHRLYIYLPVFPLLNWLKFC